MSTKEELFFLDSPHCGSLYYHNVYSFYDEPIIFTALNEFEQLFFCYSLGCNDSHDRWIIVPTSQDKVNKLEQKDLSIVKMIKPSAKAKVLLVNIDLETFAVTESLTQAKTLPYKMPDESIFIRENINYDGKRKFSHKVRIARNTQTPLMSETLNKVSEVFIEFCRHYLNKFDIPVSWYAQDAIEGSFVYRMKTVTKDEDKFMTDGYRLLSEISSYNNFVNSLEEREIDLRVTRKLFELISTNNIEIQLIEENSTNVILNLNSNYIQEILPRVDDMLGTYLDSTMVPQADSLHRIQKYLNIISEKRTVKSGDLGVDPRQVSYYRDACKILSLIHDYSSLTPLGQKVASSNNEQEWIKIIQRQFEESDCGNLWMLNQNVESLIEIDEQSASEFLIRNCNGLSDSTSIRRAKTLKSWVKTFKAISKSA